MSRDDDAIKPTGQPSSTSSVEGSTNSPRSAYASGHGLAPRRRARKPNPSGFLGPRADLMAKHSTTDWNLRRLMFERGLYKTNDILEPLHEYGIDISREQLFRLVTKPPVRLRVDVIGALCAILECTPNDLFTVEASEDSPTSRRATGTEGNSPRIDIVPIRLDVTTRS